VIEYVEDFPNMKFSKEATDAEAKNSSPKVIPMTKEDKKVLNSSKFKKASEATKDMKKGGMVKSSASKRADGIAVKGKTRGKIC
jgi:hypothetical protein